MGSIQTDAIVGSTIARTEREIALMQEYRTRLTADIVTGKLDVREAAAKLPDVTAVCEPAVDDVSVIDEYDDGSESLSTDLVSVEARLIG